MAVVCGGTMSGHKLGNGTWVEDGPGSATGDPLAGSTLRGNGQSPVSGPSPVTKTGPEPPTARQTEAWEAVKRLGTQVAAAKELGIKQGSVQGALTGYMARMGIGGELPGKLTPTARKAAQVPKADHPYRVRPTVPPPPPEPIIAPEPTPEPEPEAEFLLPDDSWRMDQVLDIGEKLHPMLIGAVVWLAEHGPTWTPEQAELWRGVFTQAVALIYPARHPAGRP